MMVNKFRTGTQWLNQLIMFNLLGKKITTLLVSNHTSKFQKSSLSCNFLEWHGSMI